MPDELRPKHFSNSFERASKSVIIDRLYTACILRRDRGKVRGDAPAAALMLTR
jgi:hypothetical protein